VFTKPGQLSSSIEYSVCFGRHKGFTTLCDKVDAIAVAGRVAYARHYASLLLLQAKVSEIAEKSERQMAQVMANMGSQNVQKNKPSDYQLSAAVSNRTANYNRLIITNLPMLEGAWLIENILALTRFIGVELWYSDIDHCNQLSGSHQSNAAPVFVKFVSRWMRDEFYSCYLHSVMTGSTKCSIFCSMYFYYWIYCVKNYLCTFFSDNFLLIISKIDHLRMSLFNIYHVLFSYILGNFKLQI
jgi:hypothetical protein